VADQLKPLGVSLSPAEARYVDELERRFDATATPIGTPARDIALEVLRDQGWLPGPTPGEVVFTFTAPESAPPSLRCLWVMVRAWEVATDQLSAREKDRCIAYLTSLLQGERRSQDATVNVHPGPHR